jgi:hypothetical protein
MHTGKHTPLWHLGKKYEKGNVIRGQFKTRRKRKATGKI